jgi:hypothetical protein
MRATPRRCAAFLALLVALFLLLAGCSNSSGRLITPPTATSGDLKLAPDRQSYSAHQPIGVTVTNGSSKSYYARDGLSACTYLQLEFYDTTKGSWLGVDGCTSPNAPQVRLLAPSASLPFTLAPGDSSNDPNAWVPGTYRIALQYGTASDGSGSLAVAYSSGFQIMS